MQSFDKPTVVVRNMSKVYPPERKSFFGLGKVSGEEVAALSNINFVASAGESIGVLGRNGSGKSTLLQIIAGVEPQTQGDVLVSSRPTLLGVSAALQPELNAWENTRLGLLAMGKTPNEVVRMEEDVVLWAALGRASYRPMKTYSSGMQARLKFSIATAVPREILLVDEALSTGDATFANRAKRRVKEFIDAAGTVFVVSHAPGQIEEYCKRCLWIHEGEIVADSTTKWVSRVYNKWTQYVSNDRDDLAENLISQVRDRYQQPTIILDSEAALLLENS